MALLTIRGEERVLTEAADIREFLSAHDIWYRRFERGEELAPGTSGEDVLEAYKEPVEELKEQRGYQTADVVDITPDLPGLEAMLDKFNREHWHSEDEVRFIVRGRGLFHLRPRNGPVFMIEVRAGDMINVPARMYHWFHLGQERSVCAIRLFVDPAGWVANYTESGREERYTPMWSEQLLGREHQQTPLA